MLARVARRDAVGLARAGAAAGEPGRVGQQIADGDVARRRHGVDLLRRPRPLPWPARRGRRAGAGFAIATFVSLNSGMNRDTGSVSRTFPSSTIIMMATPVTGLVIDAMRKMPSLRIGVFALEVHQPLRLEVRDAPLARHDRDGAGDLLRVDVALDDVR